MFGGAIIGVFGGSEQGGDSLLLSDLTKRRGRLPANVRRTAGQLAFKAFECGGIAIQSRAMSRRLLYDGITIIQSSAEGSACFGRINASECPGGESRGLRFPLANAVAERGDSFQLAQRQHGPFLHCRPWVLQTLDERCDIDDIPLQY